MTLASTTAAQEIFVTSLRNDGGTFDRHGRSPREGYAVTRKILDTSVFLTEGQIAEALSTIDPDQYVGTWLDRENYRWEVSVTEVFDDLDDALLIAAAMSERYVYDLAADDCIAVPAVSTASN